MPPRAVSSQHIQAAQPARASADDRRRQLIQIAFDEIATKGFEGLRFQEVAAKAGITNATLYYHFASKESLIEGLVQSLMDELKGVEQSVGHSPESGIAELRGLFEEVQSRVTKDPRFFIVITELALRARRDPVIDRIGKQRDDFWRRRLRSILERGIADGSFRNDLDVETTVLALMVQIKGIGHHAAVRKRKPSELQRIIEEIAAQVECRLTDRDSRPG
jgi:AcrR family transcriptional regulator